MNTRYDAHVSTPDVFTEDVAAHAVLEAQENSADIEADDGDGLELIRIGDSAVFHVGDTLVARVARPHVNEAEIQRSVAVGQWLQQAGLPADRPVLGPVRGNSLPVTFWWLMDWDAVCGTTADLGDLLGRLHALPLPADLELSPLRPFDLAERRLSRAAIDKSDRAYLRERLAGLREAYDELPFELPAGPVHGDASIDNVLLGGEFPLGNEFTPALINLEHFAIGPREWDLVPSAVLHERLGWYSEKHYLGFVEAYGDADIREWSGYPVLADLYELLMVTASAQRADQSPGLAAEFARRVDDLKTGGSRHGWQRHYAL